MGDKVEPRRKWIEKHVEFSMEDEKSILEEGSSEIVTEDGQAHMQEQVKKEAIEKQESSEHEIEQIALDFESGEE